MSVLVCRFRLECTHDVFNGAMNPVKAFEYMREGISRSKFALSVKIILVNVLLQLI